jgi:hydroxymethylglutaryl-CoA lyase
MGAMSQIQIIEVSPRDGLQNEKTLISTANKVDLVQRAARAGARRIEAVSFVNPTRVPQMADAAEVMAALRADTDLKAQGVSLIGLALNRRGFDRALTAAVDEVNFVVVASETFNRRNQAASIAETMAQIAGASALAAVERLTFGVTIAAAFGCPFEGEVPEARISALVTELAGMGVEEIALADTIGVGDPVAVERRIALAKTAAPNARIRCHFHNTRNTGLANAYAAWRSGASALDTSIGGVGGCPFAPAATGNIPTEDTVYMLERMGVSTGYDLAAVIAAAAWLGERLGTKDLPSMLGKAGQFPPAKAF